MSRSSSSGRRRSLVAVVTALGAAALGAARPAAHAEGGEARPALEAYLRGPGLSGAPSLALNVRGYPVDVRVPVPGALAYLREQLGPPEVAAALQAAVDAHAGDPGLGEVDDVRYRLRVLVRGAQEFASQLNGRARELNHRALDGDAASKGRVAGVADRRDAAITLATWATLDLFHAEGGSFDPASLERRAADLAVGVDWPRVETLLAGVLDPTASAAGSGTAAPTAEADNTGSPTGGSRGKSVLAQSITFQRAEGQPGREGAGVEVFTWHPNATQLNRGSSALRVRVDMPAPEAGMASWVAVRSALPAEAYSPTTYTSFNPAGKSDDVLVGLLRVARTIQEAATEAYRRELLTAAGGDPARYRFWRSRATQATAPAGCPARLRAAAGSYLAAMYWAEGLRAALVRQAGSSAVLAAGDAPRPGVLLLPGEMPGDDL